MQLDVDLVRGALPEIGPWALRTAGGIALLIVGIVLCRIARRAAWHLFRGASLDEDLARLLGNVVYYLLIAVVLIAVFGIVGIETASLITILGASSLAIGLALQGSLSNFASGVVLMMTRPFRAGDFIETGEFRGRVAELGTFFTVLDTVDNVRIVIPNTYVAERPLENWTVNGVRRLDLALEIAISSDLDAVRAGILAMLAADEHVLREPAPHVSVDTFGDTSVCLLVRPWCRPEHYFELRYSLPERLKQAVEESGGAMPTPQREILLPERPA